MGCNCKKKNQETQTEARAIPDNWKYQPQKEERIKPTDSCIACAQKHFAEAYCQLTEFGYLDENRTLAQGNLRQVVLHSYKDWHDIAKLARECALLVQSVEDDKALEKMKTLGQMIDKAFYEANPEAKKRLDELKSKMEIKPPEWTETKIEKPDIIIPLGNGSTHNNEELRMLLRSINDFVFDYGRVFLATQHCPDWIDRNNVIVVDVPDKYTDNKDANLWEKTLYVLKNYDVGKFIWSADDNAFLKPVPASELIPLHNHRPNSIFYEPNQGKWRNRVRNTLEWAKKRGVELPHTYESHAPQLFDGRKLLQNMDGVDYASQPGLTIYTSWYVLTDSWHDTRNQPDYKWTFENPIDETVINISDHDLYSKMYIGYSEACADKVLTRLQKVFDKPSKFEKGGGK